MGALTVIVYQPRFDWFILSASEVHVSCEPFCAVAFLYTPSLDPCQKLKTIFNDGTTYLVCSPNDATLSSIASSDGLDQPMFERILGPALG